MPPPTKGVSSCLVLALFALSTTAFAEDAQLAGLFTKNSVQGTLVISSLDGATTYIHNDTRAAFKIFLTLPLVSMFYPSPR